MSVSTGASDPQSRLSMEKASLLEKRLQRARLAVSGEGISQRPQGVPAPLSFAQQRLWFLEQLEPGTNTYNVPRALRFKGDLSVAALERTINEIKRRHEVLRTTFRIVDGKPVQEVAPLQATSLPTTDLRSLGEDDRNARLRQLALDEAQEPVDLVRGPLMRTALIRLNNDEYVLLITLHHIISDGWSTGILMREMETLYKAYAAGNPSPLPEMRIQYADFSYWQREWLKGNVLEEQLSYWREHLKDLPASLDLPADRQHSARRSFRGANKGITLTQDLTAALKAFARQEEATLFMTLLTAFKVLLYRYSSQEDIVVGTPIANRNRVEIEGLIGFFINSLPLRTHLSGELTFRELSRRVKDVALEAYAHQDLPFEKLVEELQPERSLNHTPLFQVMFVLQNAPRDVMELPGLSITLSEIVTETAKYDLFMYALEVKDRLHVGLQYSAELFDEATITTMLDRYRLLLEAAVANPETCISDLAIIDPGEAKRILVDWNDEKAYPQDRRVHQLFEAQAARHPEAVALSIAGAQIDYSQLNELSNKIAHGLSRLGIRPSQPVAVMLDTSVNQIAALLGVLKAGGCFVCLDPNYPAARLLQILCDAEPVCLISESACLKDNPAIIQQFTESTAGGVIVDLTKHASAGDEGDVQSYGWDWFEAAPIDNPEAIADPGDPAYIVYTSGSTGKPKGIVQSHASFCQFIEWQSAEFNIGPEERVAQWASVSYDASYCEIFGALCFGATLCLADRSIRYDARALVGWLKAERISLLQVVPSFCRLILDSIDSETYETGGNPLPDLKVMLLAGEVVPVDLATEWLTRFSSRCSLFNLYGPTESVLATFYRIEEIGANQKSIPVGRAIAGRQILILDRNGRLCPIGIRGEIHIRSKYLTSGYFRQPELTQQSFIQNPLHNDYRDLVYRTGDLGRWLPDGNIEFSGRVDNQVKIRGMRVELEDIESVLSRHQAVAECAVVANDSGDLDKRLIAYVCVNEQYNKSHEQASEAALGAQHVEQYQDIYNEIYSIDGTFSEHDPGISLRVWTSSYTGKPFDEDEIVECVNDTVGRILSLSPNRALEIACGTGLLLFRIAPHCSRYFGTDISDVGVTYLQKELDKLDPPISGVTLLRKAAHEVNQIPEERFDAIIVNDVVPYFPTLDYLVEVIENSIRVIEPPGFIFLGGLRALGLLEAFHTSVQLGKAPASLKRDQLQQRIHKQMVSEKELLIDPDFFIALKQRIPAISHVQVELKGGRYHNEVTRFQYDAVLYVGERIQQQAEYRELDWEKDVSTIAALKEMLSEDQPDLLRINQVPNARVIAAAKAVELIHSDQAPETATELREALRTIEDTSGIDPEEFWALGKELPYHVNIDWWRLRADGSYNVVLKRRAGGEGAFMEIMPQPTEADLSKPWKEFSNDPLKEKFRAGLIPELRNFLAANLPQHMVPSAFMFLDELPRTPTGKVQRSALLKFGANSPDTGADYEPPQTELESLIAGVWQTLLRVDRVGRNDSFFALGGHSLLATQVINKVGQLCSVNVPLRSFFESPTVASLAEHVEEAQYAAQSEIERMSEIIGRVRELSDDEAQSLIEGLSAFDPGATI